MILFILWEQMVFFAQNSCFAAGDRQLHFYLIDAYPRIQSLHYRFPLTLPSSEIHMVQNHKASSKAIATFLPVLTLQIWNLVIPKLPRFLTVLLATISKFFSLQG